MLSSGTRFLLDLAFILQIIQSNVFNINIINLDVYVMVDGVAMAI